MTPDHFPLLAAVRAAPGDNLPRLVYADWLDEQSREMPCSRCKGVGVGPGVGIADAVRCTACSGTGRVGDEVNALRAEFIRFSCRHGRAVNAKGTQAWLSAHARVARLLDAVIDAVGETHQVNTAFLYWQGGNVRLTLMARIHNQHFRPFFHRIVGYDRTEQMGDWLIFYSRKGEGERHLNARVKQAVNDAMWGLAHDRAFHGYGSPTRACVLCRENPANHG